MAQYVTHITKGGTTRYFKDRRVGELSDLLTEHSESIVEAINELNQRPVGVSKEYVDSLVMAESQRAQDTEEGLRGSIQAENERSMQAEAGLSSNILAEQARAEGAESALAAGKQNKLVAGNNITIDPVTNVISSTSGEGGAGMSFLEFSVVDGEIVQTDEQKVSNEPIYAKMRDGERAVMAIVGGSILVPLYIRVEDGIIEIDFGSYGLYEANYAWVLIDENDDLADYEYDSTTPVTPAYLQQQGYANSSTIGLRHVDGLRFYNQGGSIIVKTEDAQRNADILRAIFGGGVVNPIVVYFDVNGREIYHYVSSKTDVQTMSSEVVFERTVAGVTKRFTVHCNFMSDYQSAEVAEVRTSITRVELEYYSMGNTIIKHGDSSLTALTYEQVAALVDDRSNFVTLLDTDGEYLLPQWNDGAAIIFTGLNVLSYGTWAHRIAINLDNDIKAEYYELAQQDALQGKQDKTFYATYGVTPYADIVNAFNAKKQVMCRRGNFELTMVRIDDEKGAIFTCNDATSSRSLHCQPNSIWKQDAWIELEDSSLKQSVITESATNYPSSKAVVDYVAENAPTKSELTELSSEVGEKAKVTPILTSGTQIATITTENAEGQEVETPLYAPQGGGGGIPDVPEDGMLYLRQNGAWSPYGKRGVLSQKQNWNASNTEYTISDKMVGVIPQSFIDEWIDATKAWYDPNGGLTPREIQEGSFNEQTGYFELHGLTDLTYHDARMIMLFGRRISINQLAISEDVSFRTIIVPSASLLWSTSNAIHLQPSKKCEVLTVPVGWTGVYRWLLIKRIEITLPVLHTIKNVMINATQTFTTPALRNCNVMINGNINFNLARSPLLTMQSVKDMIELSAGTCTLTLHKDVYDAAIADSGVQAAMAAHTNITLASA